MSAAKATGVVGKSFGEAPAGLVAGEALEELAGARQTIFVQGLLLERLHDKVGDLEGRLEASRRTIESQARLIEALQEELSLWRGNGSRRA